MVELEGEVGSGHGIWQNLHGFAGAGASICGAHQVPRHARADVPRAFDAHAADPAELTETQELRKGSLVAHLPKHASGQVRSVAARFALVAAAGKLATIFGITGWPKGAAVRAAGACF
jgi:putative DNA primase/helicase